jgi:hypothetical protein
VLGENVWWYCKDGHICFLDGPEEPVGHSPSLRHFRSSSLKEEYSYLERNWAKCIWKFENKGMKLPLQKIKVYKNGKHEQLCRKLLVIILKRLILPCIFL